MDRYRSRTVELLVTTRLRTHGAVLLTGAKAVGKTTTARGFAASEVRLDQDRAALTAARTDPRLVLDGDHPRLIDEYQLAEGVWDAVRGRVDDLGGKGLFILTGSATPAEEHIGHTGARRIAPVTMRTMSMFERGLSTGDASVGGLLAGRAPAPGRHERSITEVIEAVVVGGWPDSLELAPSDGLDANVGYLEVIINTDVRRVDGARRDPDGIRRLVASYARSIATDASLRTIARTDDVGLSEPTLRDYLNALRRLFLIEDQDSWKPSLRSRVRLAATPKRHLADLSVT